MGVKFGSQKLPLQSSGWTGRRKISNRNKNLKGIWWTDEGGWNQKLKIKETGLRDINTKIRGLNTNNKTVIEKVKKRWVLGPQIYFRLRGAGNKNRLSFWVRIYSTEITVEIAAEYKIKKHVANNCDAYDTKRHFTHSSSLRLQDDNDMQCY